MGLALPLSGQCLLQHPQTERHHRHAGDDADDAQVLFSKGAREPGPFREAQFGDVFVQTSKLSP